MSAAVHLWHLFKAGGRPREAALSRWRAMATEILRDSAALGSLDETELRTRGKALRWRAKAGVPLAKLLPEAFALTIEAAWRTCGMRHYSVQVMGGIALAEGGVAEMATGEGKTLTAVLTAVLYAFAGLGSHVITVNDYLARRDRDGMEPIYQMCGLTVGCIQGADEPAIRATAYAQDVTYGTAKEFGFDFLRDRLRRTDSGGDLLDPPPGTPIVANAALGIVQRGLHFALVDEADSILIDEARTPLLIALPQPAEAAARSLYRWCNTAAQTLRIGVDFIYEPAKKNATLSPAGCRKIVLLGKPTVLDTIEMERVYSQVEKSIAAQHGFVRDRDYLINDAREVVLIDESTGRTMEGRRWQDGLHQAMEVKEQIPLTNATGQAARITVQSFFRQYTHLAGMTGTGQQVAGELKRTYGLQVTAIPTHRKNRRVWRPYRVFLTLDAKMRAAAASIAEARELGRAVLVGTPSVEKSEMLSKLLGELQIPHRILNAKHHAREAAIVAEAGQPGSVMIATNMAGRGTDIHLADSVRAAGGLHVVATEMHSSSRIDRQLIGRAARQGDPGSYQFFLSLEDELLSVLPRQQRQLLQQQASREGTIELPERWCLIFRKIQQTQERTHTRQRRDLLKREEARKALYLKMGLDPTLEMTDS